LARGNSMKLHEVLYGAVAACAAAVIATGASAGGSLKDDRPFSWSGFSIGVHTGYGFEGSGDQNNKSDTLGFIDNFFNGVKSGVKTEGQFVGVSLARDWQSGHFVYGILVDISKSDFKGFSIPDGNTDNDGFETKIDWFGTVRGKLGYASGPYLLYATGGLAYGQVKATQGDVDPPGNFDPGTGVVTGKETRIGWTAGGGVDVAVGSNLVLGVEYLYVDLGDDAMTLNRVGGAGSSRVEIDSTMHTVRANLRYKF
jgi:outer membrane immunogenic protein